MMCGQLTQISGSQCVDIGNDGETAYCVKVMSGKAAVYSINGSPIGRCDVDSTGAWLVDGKCIF